MLWWWWEWGSRAGVLGLPSLVGGTAVAGVLGAPLSWGGAAVVGLPLWWLSGEGQAVGGVGAPVPAAAGRSSR